MTFTKQTFLGLLLLAGNFTAATAQFKLTDPMPLDSSLKIGKLPNGLTYYIQRNPKPEKKVELRLVVNAGSVLENDNQQGLAHFMEHMGFNGTTHFPKNELVNFLQKAGVKFGADLNAYTSFDETVYILPLPTDDPNLLNKGLTVLEDWAFNNLFDKTEIEKERGVVLEESRLSKGAWERMSRKYFPKLFNGSKYAERLTIGKDELLKTFKPETLKNFYKNWYRPNLMAVMVVGDIEPMAAEKLIISHFGKYNNPAGAPARPGIIAIKPRAKQDAMIATDDEATNTFVQIYNFVKPATTLKTWSDYRANLVENIISAIINQRLQELTQKENPAFIFGNTGFNQFLRGYQSFNSFAVLSKGSVEEAINALIQETNRARKFGFLQSELDRVKASLLDEAERAYKERAKSESGGLIEEYVNSFLTHAPLTGVANRYQFMQINLSGIGLNEINSIARQMPGTENAFTLIQAPTAVKDQLPDSSKLLQIIAAANNLSVKPYEEKQVIAQLLDKAPVAGKIISQTNNAKLGTIDYALNNGVTVTIKPTQLKNDEIQMDAWRWGGAHKYQIADKDNASNAAQIVQQMGVKDLSPTELNKFLAGKTINVMPYINPDEEGIQGSSSIKDFETFLQLVYLYLTSPRKDDGLFRSFIGKQKASLEFIQKNPQAAYQDTLYKILYNNNPWMNPIPKASDYDNITVDRSLDIYKEIFGNANGLHFTFVGNIDSNTIIPALEKYLGSLPSSSKEPSFKDIGARMLKGNTEVAIKRGKSTQAVLNLFFEGETNYNRDNRLQLAALLEVLNIEIIEKLREEMSAVYGGGMSGAILKRPYEHYSIRAYIPCGPENVDKLTNALIELIRNVQQKGIKQQDLDKVKETWKKQYHVNLQNNEYWLENLSSAYINKDNPENILDYEQKIDSITASDLQEIARKFLTLDNMVKSVLYPESFNIKEAVKTTQKGF
jgi:zinc protease